MTIEKIHVFYPSLLLYCFFCNIGIYDHDTKYETYIDISKIPELVTRQTSPRLELGGGTTLHDLLELMEQLADQQPSSYHYGKQFGIHLRKVNFYAAFYF